MSAGSLARQLLGRIPPPDRRGTSVPPPPPSNPLVRIVSDVAVDIRGRGRMPPGPNDPSLGRVIRITREPLPILLEYYERYGPIFSMRIAHTRQIWMLGPEANHFLTVSGADKVQWRHSNFGDLFPLLGDGMLTIDGGYHRRARRIMLPVFHRERIAAMQRTMVEEAEGAIAGWRPGETVDLYHWAREVAMRIAMRALLGLDPDEEGSGATAAREFESALGLYGQGYAGRILRGPGSPWRRMLRSRAELDRIVYREIEARRGRPRGDSIDLLGLLLEARDEEGERLTDREVRDQLMTLLFAGHDTSTSTISFLMYELARHPAALAELHSEQDEVLAGRAPEPGEVWTALPRLEQAVDETLRLYPPAWIGPRRAVEDFEFAGHPVPAGAYVNYSSWASHRLPEIFPEPEAFLPERFAPERRAALPKGAYVPFGGGSRTCIGMRFGQMEVMTVAAILLQRLRLELLPGRTMRVRQMPTLSPDGGLWMRVRERDSAP